MCKGVSFCLITLILLEFFLFIISGEGLGISINDLKLKGKVVRILFYIYRNLFITPAIILDISLYTKLIKKLYYDNTL